MKNRLSITIDIEDWYHIPSVTGSPFSVYKDVNEFFEKWKGRYDYLRKPTKRVLDLLDDFDIRATFFVVADVVDHYPGLVESIVERGHEIGCHGLHQKLTFVNFIYTDGRRLTQMGNKTSKKFGIFKPRLKDWLRDPTYIFWLGVVR